MFEMLTGRLPFSGDSAFSIALKHLTRRNPSPRRYNPEFRKVSQYCNQGDGKRPYYRYDDVEAIIGD